MRRLIASIVAVLMVGSVAAATPVNPADPLPMIPRACTPDAAPFDIARPASCQRIRYVYGPVHAPPGGNLILAGPVTVEKPLVDGFVVRFKPDLIFADGSVPAIDVVHLHHAVWLSTSFADPIFASGEEKTTFHIPNGYGIPVKGRGEAWILNHMVHNQTPVAQNVFITYEIDFIPAPAAVTSVAPYWLNVGGHNGLNPVYNSQRGYGSGGTCAFPRQICAAFDPYGAKPAGQGSAPKPEGQTRSVGGSIPAGTVVMMLGHVHPGGLRTDVELSRPGKGRARVFTSDAVYFDPGGPISWDMSMEETLPSYRLRIQSGDTFVLNSVYDAARGSWYEAMGIVVMFVAAGDSSGADPFTAGFDPDRAAITHGHLAEADNHGGAGESPLPSTIGVASRTVSIAGFRYLPGDLGARPLGVPVVRAGEGLTFVNLEAAGIYHTVTACRAPCNGATGISYPLADGPVDFDSLELGYGPPGVTAAANTDRFTLSTAGFTPGTYTYFCRIHPFMRGAFEVV